MRQLRTRLRYILLRLRRIAPSNLFAVARRVRAEGQSRRPEWVLVLDLLWCSVRYELAFADYAFWEFASLTGAERRTWMTNPKSYRLTQTRNAPEARRVLEDKVRFLREHPDAVRRDWVDVRSATDAELDAFVAAHPEALAKPIDGQGGGGVGKVSIAGLDAAALRARMTGEGRPLLEELVVQHPAMAALNPSSVNTVRLITYLAPDGAFHPIANVLRIGNGGVVDNFAGGGMFTMLDGEGVALYPAVDKAGRAYPEHPATGTPIKGFRVPHFAEALALVEGVSRRIPDVPYIGWDVAITADGPLVIEANNTSTVFQMRPSVSGVRTGLLPAYRAAVGF